PDGKAARRADQRRHQTTETVMTKSVPSVGQMVRVLLEQAIEDGLVDPANSRWDDPDLPARTAEGVAGVAGLPSPYLRARPKHRGGIACQPPGAVLGGSAARSVPAARTLRQRVFAVAAAGHLPSTGRADPWPTGTGSSGSSGPVGTSSSRALSPSPTPAV